MNAFLAIIKLDIMTAFRAGGSALLASIFFALVILVFALATGPDKSLMTQIAAPVLWTGALLSTLVSFPSIFHRDYEDGALDVLVETAEILELRFLAKAIAHWISTCLPLVLLSPLFGVMLGLPTPAYGPLFASLLIGTPSLSLIGALSAAITMSVRRATILVSILSAPLFTPVIIFGASASQAGISGAETALPSFLFLAATGLVSLIVAPLAGGAAIRANLS